MIGNPELNYFFYILKTNIIAFKLEEETIKIEYIPVYYVIRSFYPFSYLFY